MAETLAKLFLHFFNAGISALWIVAAALLFRLIFKKAPKWINVLLWGIVALRLILPFSIESSLSIVPSAETVSPAIMYEAEPQLTTGFPAMNSAINPIILSSFSPAPEASANPLQIVIPTIATIWVCGVFLMLSYLIISYAALRIRMKTAVRLDGCVYQCEKVKSPFVLGIIRPKIYIPFSLQDSGRALVTAHEKAHIRRHDNLIKPIAFILLSLYWFNPALWLAYILLCRDIEYACDEKVIKKLGEKERADYSETMLNLSAPRKLITACPLAFGEVGVKERIKRVLNYKKPLLWIIIVAVVSCAVIAVVLLTDPVKDKTEIPKDLPQLEDTVGGYTVEQAISDGCVAIISWRDMIGKDVWEDFLSKTESGKAASVRVYLYYPSSESKHDHCVKELSFDGQKYKLEYYDYEGGTDRLLHFIYENDYLVESTTDAYYSTSGKTYKGYLLSDKLSVSLDGYFSVAVSSDSFYKTEEYGNTQLIFSYVEKDDTPVAPASWPALEDTVEGYTVEQAKTDGCVVISGYELISGSEIWNEFTVKAATGESAAVRIYLRNSPSLDYNHTYVVKELICRGGKYRIRFYDYDRTTGKTALFEKDYKFLTASYMNNYYSSSSKNNMYKGYMLSNDRDVSLDGYFRSHVSSALPREEKYQNSHVIFYCIDNEYYIVPLEYDRILYDIDGNGEKEDVHLTRGSTSGLFSFEIKAYEYGKLKYSGFYVTPWFGEMSLILYDYKPTVMGMTSNYEKHYLFIVPNGEHIDLYENGELAYKSINN